MRHLGNYIEYNLNESGEISRKRGDLFGRVNSMLGNLQGMPSNILLRVFESQCCHLYGCQAWRLCDTAVNKMRTAFNRCIRRILNLPYATHCYLLPILASCQSLLERVYRRSLKLIESLKGTNSTIEMLSKICLEDSASIVSSNKTIIEGFSPEVISEEDKALAQTIVELMGGVDIFSPDDCNYCANFLCTC